MSTTFAVPGVPASAYPGAVSPDRYQAQAGSGDATGKPAMSHHPDDPKGIITNVQGIVPTLQNIVATVNLECRLDLKTIALHARNAEYNPKRFAAVIMRIREPKTTALIFASGKMVVTGAKSEDDSRLAACKYARIIQKLGFEAKHVSSPPIMLSLAHIVNTGLPSSRSKTSLGAAMSSFRFDSKA